jgi:hypothetical protein
MNTFSALFRTFLFLLPISTSSLNCLYFIQFINRYPLLILLDFLFHWYPLLILFDLEAILSVYSKNRWRKILTFIQNFNFPWPLLVTFHYCLLFSDRARLIPNWDWVLTGLSVPFIDGLSVLVFILNVNYYQILNGRLYTAVQMFERHWLEIAFLGLSISLIVSRSLG